MKKHPGPIYFRSQHAEDVIMDKFFQSKTGFYVDIGAASGRKISNTWFFAKLCEWKGICVEPSILFFDKLMVNRPESTNICVAVSDYSGEIILHQHPTGFICTTNIDEAITARKEDKKKLGIKMSEYTPITVPVCTIDEILDNYNAPQKIDIFSLDVEGSEQKVLSKFKFEKYDVTVFIVEAISKKQQNNLKKLFSKHDYHMALQLGGNMLFVREKNIENIKIAYDMSKGCRVPHWLD